MTDPVDTLRRFNRSYTQRIGVLDDSFLGSGRPVGAARLLFEIGPEGATVRSLRARLGLDSGYLSRLLRHLEDDGAVELTPDPADRRRRIVRLTDAGRTEWHELDRRSDELANRLLAPLGERQRNELVEALATADRIVRAATVDVQVADPRSDEALDALTHYFDELDHRFPTGFDPGDAITHGLDEFRPPAGAFLLAVSDGAAVACGALQRVDQATAEIKRMWVHDQWRGLGLGKRMLAELEHAAVRLGYGRVLLDTNATLTEAIAMYTSAGYEPTERYNDNPYAQRWFTKALPPIVSDPDDPGTADA